MSSLHQTVCRLAAEIHSVAQAARGGEERATFSTGVAPLDRLLPGGGLRRGMLVEWLPASEGSGSAGVMALLTARAARSGAECGVRNVEWNELGPPCRTRQSGFGPLVIIDRHGTFYPPAAAAWGVPLSSMILLRPGNLRDETWALDQTLRSPAVAAVLAWPHRLDGRAFRRLQLAVESSGAIGVFVRPASARKEPTWADVRLCVENLGFQISLPRDSRLGTGGREVPNSQSGWQFCLERLRTRSCVHQHHSVQIEITPEGQIHEITSADHSLPQRTPITHPKSAS